MIVPDDVESYEQLLLIAAYQNSTEALQLSSSLVDTMGNLRKLLMRRSKGKEVCDLDSYEDVGNDRNQLCDSYCNANGLDKGGFGHNCL